MGVIETEKLLEDISKKNFDKQKYVNMILSDEETRDFMVDTMINHPKIMNYYHCFYVISDASVIKPELFYKYWDRLVQLLKHPNSYHRDFSLILLANMASIDSQNKFKKIIEDYLELLKDEKYMTAECCVKNSSKIAAVKPILIEKIVKHLLNLEHSSKYSDKQKALMMSYVIEGLERVIHIYPNKTLFLDFAKKQLTSISPKTRKVAKRFLSNYG